MHFINGHHFFITQISRHFFYAQHFSNAQASSDATSRHLDHQRQVMQVRLYQHHFDDCVPFSEYIDL